MVINSILNIIKLISSINNKYKDLNKVIIKQSVNYYSKCWAQWNDIVYNEEN